MRAGQCGARPIATPFPELSDTEGELQTEKTHVPMASATYLKFKILSGYDDFVSVQAIEVEASRSR